MMCSARLSWRSPPRCSRWRFVLPELAGIGAVPAWRAKHASVGKRLGGGGVSDDDRGGDRTAAALGEPLRAVSFDQRLELGQQRLLLLADLADPLEGRLRNAKLWAAGQLPELAGEPRPDAWAFQPGGPELRLELRGDLHQMPAQPVDVPDALVDELVAVVGQDPDLIRLLVQKRDWQRVDPFSERGSRDRGRVDRVRLPGFAHRPSRGLSQPRRDPHDPVAAGEQPALKAPGHVSAVLDRPHPLLVELCGEPKRFKRTVV